MERLQLFFASGILLVWVFVCYQATRDKELIALATVITPVMLLPAGWLFTGGYLRARRGQRNEPQDGQGNDQGNDDAQ